MNEDTITEMIVIRIKLNELSMYWNKKFSCWNVTLPNINIQPNFQILSVGLSSVSIGEGNDPLG